MWIVFTEARRGYLVSRLKIKQNIRAGCAKKGKRNTQ